MQSVSIAGTPYELHYQSDRQLDRIALNTLTIPLSAPTTTLPSSLERIEVSVAVAGRQFEYCFDSVEGAPCVDIPEERTVTFTWDGLDVYGRLLQGRTPADISIGYVYVNRYGQPGQSSAEFGQTTGAVPLSLYRNRQYGEIVAGKSWHGAVGVETEGGTWLRFARFLEYRGNRNHVPNFSQFFHRAAP